METPQASQLERKIAALEAEIFSLRSEFERAKRQGSLQAAAGTNTILTAAKKQETTTHIVPAPAPKVVAQLPSAAAIAPATAVKSETAESTFSWEWLIGGNIIGKIGIVTLIVSTALFMVYALDQGWLSEWIRLIMLQGAFAGLSYASYNLYRRNYKYIPEILAITALAANTIAIYSAHFVYRFLGRIETMAMMFAVMALALLFARRIRSAALSMILFVGFFALPVIHSRGVNEPKAYFLYLMAVNILYLLLQLKPSSEDHRAAPHTIWVMALGNAVSVFGWVGTYNQYATTPLIFCATTLAILLFSAHRAEWNAKTAHFFRPAAVIVVNLLYATMVSSVLSTNKNFSDEITALAILCLGAINFLVVQTLPAEKRHLSATALIVTLLMSTGISVIMNGPAERLVQATLLTLAMFVAGRAGDRLLYAGAAVANGINFIALLGNISHGSNNWFLLNFQAAGFLFYSAAAIWLRFKEAYPKNFSFGPILTAVALLASFVGILTELQRVVTGKDARLLMITLVFAAYALFLLFVGFKWQKVWFRQAGLFFMGLAIAKFYFVDIWQWDKSVRIIAGIIMGGGLVTISFYYEKFRSKFKEMGLLLVLTGLALPAGSAEAAEKFKPNRYKFVKELALKSEPAGEKTVGSAVIDAELYKSAGENDLRLVYDGKVVPYARQMRKTGENRKVEKEIAPANLITSVDGDNTSVYIFENHDRIRISSLKLNFREKDYTREVLVYQRPGKFQNNVLAKSITLTRKAGKPELHTIDFAAVSGEIQLQVRNDDDEALNLTQFIAVSDKEYLVFRIPEKYADAGKKLQLYYGAEYAQKPKYDLTETLSDESAFAEFSLLAESKNPDFRLTLFDPPYSVWFFRTVFWLLLVLIAWRMLALYRRDRTAD